MEGSNCIICDVCSSLNDATDYRYCGTCMQKLCRACCDIHGYMTASREHTCKTCMPESDNLEPSFVKSLVETFGSLHAAAKWTSVELGVPVCINYQQDTIQLNADSYDILELAVGTLCHTVFNDGKKDGKKPDVVVLMKRGSVEWVFNNTTAAIVRNLYKDEIDKLKGLFDSVAVVPFCRSVTPHGNAGLTRQAVSRKDRETGKHSVNKAKHGTNTDKATVASSRVGQFGSQFTNSDELERGEENGYGHDLERKADRVGERKNDFKFKLDLVQENSNESKLLKEEITPNEKPKYPDNMYQQFVIRCSVGDYMGVKEIIGDIEKSIENLYKTEVTRPRKDAFRVNIYKMIKETGSDVLCTSEQLGSGVTKLVIRGKNQNDVIDTKREFLSIFCKECSVCRTESNRPMYLECKHLLCQPCVQKATHLNTGLVCQICDSLASNRSTPVPSLQVHCLDSLGDLVDGGQRAEQVVAGHGKVRKMNWQADPVEGDQRDANVLNGRAKVRDGIGHAEANGANVRKVEESAKEGEMGVDGQDDDTTLSDQDKMKVANMTALRKPRKPTFSEPKARIQVKVPKYLLQKWAKRPGGLMKLKSVIENEFGFETDRPLDTLTIAGKDRELLDLAIYSLETQNDAGPEHGVRRRLIDKSVEWRFKGDFAKIVNSLFHSELHGLTKKHKTVTLSVFTKHNPATVDVKSAFSEYQQVKFDIDELENEIKSLFEDEYIQPRTFYYNVKVKDFVYSKENNTHVFCTLTERKNLNVITLKARKRELINGAKDELSNW